MFGAQRPRLLVCYICGREYGTKSLPIHIPQCIKKWEDVEALKPPRERRPVPPPPIGQDPLGAMPCKGRDIQAFNEAMYQQFEEMSLEHCEFCGRSFNPEAFKKHKNLCTADRPFRPKGTGLGGGQPLRAPGLARRSDTGTSRAADACATVAVRLPEKLPPRPQTAPGPAQRPMAYTCYICGNQFGSSSLHIHIPQCKRKWEATEEARGTYRPIPPEPLGFPKTAADLPKGATGINDFNAGMSSQWSEMSLVPCAGCGRTFRPEALEHHIKGCKGPGLASAPSSSSALPARRPATSVEAKPAAPRAGVAAVQVASAGAGSSSRAGSSPDLPQGLVCYLCGSQFGISSLRIHVPQCKAKWEAEEDLKLVEERRACPPPPPELVGPLPSTPEGADAFNRIMLHEYSQRSLQPCPNCSRTFRPDALLKHSRGCTGVRPLAVPIP